MRPPRRLLIAIAFILFSAMSVRAGDIKVIANSSVKANAISAAELKSVFLQERNSLADGTHVEPVLQRSGAVHEAFLREVLGRSHEDLQLYYRALVFTGRGSMPRAFASEADVVAYVARTRGAIGYVSAATSREGVKVLAIVSEVGKAERTLLARVEPDYPETLRRLKIGGTVRLAVTISAQGKVENVQLLGGNPILAESAATAVRKWVYAPGHSQTFAQVSIPFDPQR